MDGFLSFRASDLKNPIPFWIGQIISTHKERAGKIFKLTDQRYKHIIAAIFREDFKECEGSGKRRRGSVDGFCGFKICDNDIPHFDMAAKDRK